MGKVKSKRNSAATNDSPYAKAKTATNNVFKFVRSSPLGVPTMTVLTIIEYERWTTHSEKS